MSHEKIEALEIGLYEDYLEELEKKYGPNVRSIRQLPANRRPSYKNSKLNIGDRLPIEVIQLSTKSRCRALDRRLDFQLR